MGEKHGCALSMMLATVLAFGIASPVSASLPTSPETTPPISAASQLLDAVPPALPSPFAASLEMPSLFPGARICWPRTPTGPRPYFGARYYQAKHARFTTVDPYLDTRAALVEPQRWNRYAYGRNNPLRYVDPDGRDIFEYFGGAANAFGSNFFAGAGRASGGSADFQFGQFVGDVFSLPAGTAWSEVGAGVGGLGIVGAAPTSGASLVATGVGAVAVVQGGTAVISGSIHAGIYLAKALGQAGGPKAGSEGGPGAGKRFSDKTRDAARAENPNCVFCDSPTTREPGPTQSNIDHAKAKARSGNNTLENAQNTCRDCNLRKGTKSSEEFLKQQ